MKKVIKYKITVEKNSLLCKCENEIADDGVGICERCHFFLEDYGECILERIRSLAKECVCMED